MQRYDQYGLVLFLMDSRNLQVSFGGKIPAFKKVRCKFVPERCDCEEEFK